MAQQNRTTLQALIDLYITTNGNKEITGAQLNEVLTNLNDSAFLQLDELRTALSTAYSPATPSDWNVLPTEVKAALDEAISRVEGLENAGFQTAIQTPYTATTPTDWDVVPTELQSSTDELASRVETIENEPNQTAFETPYTPTTSTDWDPEGAPTEVKGGLDILAARTVQNLSGDIAYVSVDGVDTEGVLGNSERPFKTFGAAINAVPVGGTVKALGGSYDFTNETVFSGVVIITKEGVTLDISFCQIAGRFSINKSNTRIIAIGATITNNTAFPLFSTSSGTYSNFRLIGGDWDGGSQSCVSIGSQLTGAIVRDATFISNIIGNVVEVGSDDVKFKDCFIEGTNAGNVFSFRVTSNTTGIFIENSSIISNGGTGVAMDSNTQLKLKNCSSKGGNYGLFTTTTASSNFDLIAEDCKFLSVNIWGVYLNQLCDNVRFTRCLIISEDINRQAVNLNTNRTALKDTLFEYCTFFAGANAQIFLQNEADANITYVNKCSFNKNAFAYTAQIVEIDTCYQPLMPLIIQ